VFLRNTKGVHVPHMKNTRNMQPVVMPTPAIVTMPMSMHIGAPAKPIVKAGDLVKVGQVIAEGDGFVSAPVHSSVSGKVKKLDDILLSNGSYITTVVIESDGEDALYEGLAPHPVETVEQFVAAVRESGIVGLGGAGFPASVKLAADPARVDYIVLNGAECEPYITSDTRTMINRVNDVWDGVALLRKFYSPKKIIFGIEKNKPGCIALYKDLCADTEDVEVCELPSIYPQGGEKVLIHQATGRVVPEGKLPLDVGCIVMNVTTLACIAQFIATGMPLTKKCVTVDGSAVKSPKNVIVPIGATMRDVFEFCGGFKEDPRKLLYGGPMMGIAAPSLDVPILKNTNAILAFNEKDAQTPPETPCIRCGKCILQCPLNLMPTAINSAFLNNEPDKLEKLKVNLCMECGCCNYVCPANRQLVQANKLAKAMLRTYQAAKKEEQAKKEAAAK